MTRRHWILSIFWLLLGGSLTVCGFLGLVDSYWNGMGTALLVAGVLRLVRLLRYRRDESYREAVDTAATDERNRFLSVRAWAWAGWCYVLLAALASVVFQLLGMEMLRTAAAMSVCSLMLLYWISWLILRKKY